MKFIRRKIKNNILYINTTILILMAFLSFVYDLFFYHLGLEKYMNWLFLILLNAVYYFMTVQLKIRLMYQWMIGVIITILYLSMVGYWEGSTVNWTSYLVYFIISIGMNSFFLLIPIDIKKRNKE